MTNKPHLDGTYSLEFWDPSHIRWNELKELAQHLGDSPYTFFDEELTSFYACVAISLTDEIIGYHSLLVQPIGPEMGIAEVQDRHGNTLQEVKIRGLRVLEAWRNRGIGTELQKLTLQKAAELGVFQVRSRSGRGKVENYSIKINLGFACHPDLRTFRDGSTAEGVYWVKRVNLAKS